MSLQTYPTQSEVENAKHLQICKWWRFLPTPENEHQEKIMAIVIDKYLTGGGMTTTISKTIGWK